MIGSRYGITEMVRIARRCLVTDRGDRDPRGNVIRMIRVIGVSISVFGVRDDRPKS